MFGNERIPEGKVGIVGIACVLNLISGGYKSREMGYLLQCVLLHDALVSGGHRDLYRYGPASYAGTGEAFKQSLNKLGSE